MNEMSASSAHQGAKEDQHAPMECFTNLSPDRIFVIGQLGQSLDGRIATPTGESRFINRAPALDHLHRLRAAVHAVVVGIRTVLADDPRLDVRRCQGANPARVVIDPRGRLPVGALLLRDDGARRLVIRQPGFGVALPAGTEEVPLTPGPDGYEPRDILEALAERGLRHILVEGGARTLARFIAAEALDRLHLLVAPVIIGAGQTGLDLPAPPSLALARRPLTRAIPLGDGEIIFDCNMRQPGETTHE